MWWLLYGDERDDSAGEGNGDSTNMNQVLRWVRVCWRGVVVMQELSNVCHCRRSEWCLESL